MNVALVVNPASNSIIAIGRSCAKVHPVLHATMVAIDLVARLQGGGAWETGLPLQEVKEEDQVPLDGSTAYICTGEFIWPVRFPTRGLLPSNTSSAATLNDLHV